jgi:hypothetical protein
LRECEKVRRKLERKEDKERGRRDDHSKCLEWSLLEGNGFLNRYVCWGDKAAVDGIHKSPSSTIFTL